jgi:hypothetical protein
MQYTAYVFLRIHLPRTPVNRGNKKGRSAMPRPVMGVYSSMAAPLESLGYLLDIPSVHARGVEGRNRFEVGHPAALGRSILDLTVAALDGREAVPYLPNLPVVIAPAQEAASFHLTLAE